MVGIVDYAANGAEDGSPDRDRKQNATQAEYMRRQRTPLSDVQNTSETELGEAERWRPTLLARGVEQNLGRRLSRKRGRGSARMRDA